MKIKYFLIGLLLLVIMGCGADANKGLANVQEKYKDAIVINIPESSFQFIVINNNGAIRYIATHTTVWVDTIESDIELYKKGIKDEN